MNDVKQKFARQAKITFMQLLVDELFSEINEDSARVYEPYILEHPKFQNAVALARNELEITDFEETDEQYILEWIIKYLSSGSVTDYSVASNREVLKRFYDVIDNALANAGLPESWQAYMAMYVVTDVPPFSTGTNIEQMIIIEDIDEQSISVRFKKGIHQQEYVKAWSALSKHLGSGRKRKTVPKMQQRDLEMFEKSQSGVTQRELAKEYFDGDKEYSIDSVKKALKRQRKLYDQGTDLTK